MGVYYTISGIRASVPIALIEVSLTKMAEGVASAWVQALPYPEEMPTSLDVTFDREGEYLAAFRVQVEMVPVFTALPILRGSRR
jgi:hypothetical protein